MLMIEIKSREKMDFKNIEKPRGRELIIIPKKRFLDWYKYTKGELEDVEMKKQETGVDFQECPNCRNVMENHTIQTRGKEELWHLCPKCDLSFSKKQHNYFTMMMLRLMNGECKDKKGA